MHFWMVSNRSLLIRWFMVLQILEYCLVLLVNLLCVIPDRVIGVSCITSNGSHSPNVG